MTFDKLSEILAYAIQVHLSLRKQVDFDLEDKKHAIYLLQGGALTALTSAMEFNLRGYMIPRAQQKRMIDEIVDLITFFDEINDDARQIKAWFKGQVVEREPGNKGNLTIEERASRYYFSHDQVQFIDKLKKQINEVMSKFMHPTIDAVRANAYRRTNIFDYYHSNTKSKSMSPEDFGNLYIVPVIHAILIPIRILRLTETQFNQLRSCDKEIQASY